MKTKKSEKKVKLTKVTVTNLSNREMHHLMGGDQCPPMTLGCMSIEFRCRFILNPGTIDGGATGS
jgi:natural product precursor